MKMSVKVSVVVMMLKMNGGTGKKFWVELGGKYPEVCLMWSMDVQCDLFMYELNILCMHSDCIPDDNINWYNINIVKI